MMTGSSIAASASGFLKHAPSSRESPMCMSIQAPGPTSCQFFQTPVSPPSRRRRQRSISRSRRSINNIPSSQSCHPYPHSEGYHFGQGSLSRTYRNSKGSVVPVHECPSTSTPNAQVIVRRRPWSPGQVSVSYNVNVPWKLLGVVLLLAAIPAIFYFTDLGHHLGNRFAALGNSLWKDDPVPLTLEEEEELGKIEESLTWESRPAAVHTEHREKSSTLPAVSPGTVTTDWTTMWTQLEPLIQKVINEKLNGIESKLKAELDLVTTNQLPPPPPPPEPTPVNRKELEFEIMTKVAEKLIEVESSWKAQLISAKINTGEVDLRKMNSFRDQIHAEVTNKLTAYEQKVNEEELLRTSELKGIKDQLLTELKSDVTHLVSTKSVDCLESCPTPTPPPQVSIDLTLLDDKIRLAIAKYDADKTGMADLALESAGGSIVSTRCTRKSSYSGSQLLIWNIPIWYPSNSPRKVIQGGSMPGDCWSFDGVEGFLVIKLVGPSRVTGFSMEHLPKVLSPHGNINSAPRKFQVVGHLDYNDVDREFVFGEYEYVDDGRSLQYFPVQNANDTYFPFVELKVLSNHGNVVFTCLYRFRVHGHLESS